MNLSVHLSTHVWVSYTDVLHLRNPWLGNPEITQEQGESADRRHQPGRDARLRAIKTDCLQYCKRPVHGCVHCKA